ncbi:MAG: beta-ketoacyl synthase N-terminal-like domain-containing protein [Candidatus Aceula meridiana]|nr:beta-ketoacyl synthase N-terminal-like domain-containing protein [Candidatus Aceula meridiana]
MKITFIYPRFEKFLSNNNDLDKGLVDYFLGDFTTPPSLGIPILASWTPPDVDIELIDDNSGDTVDFKAPTDLVAINCFTPQATRAFEIADGYRANGKKVVMGGFFPSFMVEECLKHADAVCVGEAEPVWETIVEDARHGRLKKKYVGGCNFDLSKMRIPKRDIFYNKRNYDWDEDLVQLTRGCLYNCAMCAIPAHMGPRIRFRPIDKVVEEIKTLKYENVYLADDVLFFPQRRIREYVTELFKALIPLNKKYFVSSTMALRTEPEFLDLAAKAGIRNFYCTMNVDPVSIQALQGGEKEQKMLCELVKNLEGRGIRFFGSFALGRDWDDTSIADRILDLSDKANIRTSEFFLFTPYPGTVHWDRLERQGRIFDRNWKHYNGAHIVAHHSTMSDEELYGQFLKVWKGFFKKNKDQHAVHLAPVEYEGDKIVAGKQLRKKGIRGQAAITGVGFLSPIGNEKETLLDSLKKGRHGISSITKFDTAHFSTNFGAEIKDFNSSKYLSDSECQDLEDPYLQHGLTAARKAIKDAGLVLEEGVINRDIAMVIGTCNGGLLSGEKEYKWLHGKSDVPFDEKMNLLVKYYGFGKALAHALKIGGETWMVTTACSSTTAAIGLAQTLIRKGYYKKVLVGGSDSLSLASMSGFNGLKALSTGQTAPFSLPGGLNIGEAACFWVVEEMEHALLRNARCYGKIAGHATTSDAYHPTSPDPRGDGVFRTLSGALRDSGIDLKDIGYINAHGTGTEANDRAESKGIAKFINEMPIPAISLKSFFAHCMGATGILETTCSLLSMNEGFIPPTINFSQARPGCHLDYVPNSFRKQDHKAFISANYAFGGNNAAAVITDWNFPTPKIEEKSDKVVITGVGVISSLGLSTEETLKALREKKKGIGSIKRLNLKNMKSDLAGLVPEFNSAQIDKRLDFSHMNPISKFATAAAKQALDSSGIRVGRGNAEKTGIVMGVCNGPSEADHMNSLFTSETFEPNISCFSNITANSTAGWVSNALYLKGVNISLAPGHHAGLQALAYAYDSLTQGQADHIVVGACDEVFAHNYWKYDLIDYLYTGEQERDYRLRLENPKQKVLGEGAGMVIMEPLEIAEKRGANILGEVLGYGMSMDGGPFLEQNLGIDGLLHASSLAIERSKIDSSEIDLVVWAPQGNAQDKKVIDACKHILNSRYDEVPLVTTTFNTGYIESASIMVTLACVLTCLKEGKALWPQLTGVDEIDNKILARDPRNILVLGSSDVGYNFAVIIKPNKQ